MFDSLGVVGCQPVQVAVGIRVMPDGQCVWADAPVCVLGPSQNCPEDRPGGGPRLCDAWAVYLCYEGVYNAHLWTVLSVMGRPSELPFGNVWDLVCIVPAERLRDAVRVYLSNRTE